MLRSYSFRMKRPHIRRFLSVLPYTYYNRTRKPAFEKISFGEILSD